MSLSFIQCYLSFISVSALLTNTVQCVCGAVITREQLRKHIFFLRGKEAETAYLQHAVSLRTLFKEVMVLQRGATGNT